MTSKTKAEIKAFFQTGDRPTEAQFIDFIDSYVDKSGPVGDIETAASAGTQGFAFCSAGGGEVIGAAAARTFQGITVYTTALTTNIISGLLATTAQAVSGDSVSSLLSPAVLTSKYATTAQAVAGQDDNKIMSPILVKNAIDALGGSLEDPIKTVTAAGATSVDFINGSDGVVLDNTYKAYKIYMTSVIPGTDAVDLHIRTDSDGGASFDSGAANYKYWTSGGNSGGTADANDNSNGATEIRINGVSNTLGNSSGESLSGEITIYNPAGTNYTLIEYKTIQVNSAGNLGVADGGGSRINAADVDAIRLITSSGTISGVFTLVGLRDA